VLALAVDACLGVRELDLATDAPVPSALVRDGGFPVAHLVPMDGRMLAVLDPSHLLDSSVRGRFDALRRRARGFLARQAKLETLWSEICVRPDAGNLHTFARLCARNGRPRAAAAARLVLKHLSGAPADGQGTGEPDRLIGLLVRLAAERRTGEVVLPSHACGDRIAVINGQVVNAWADATQGKPAVARLLAARPPEYHFVDTSPSPVSAQIHESTAALVIASLEALGAERRARLH